MIIRSSPICHSRLKFRGNDCTRAFRNFGNRSSESETDRSEFEHRLSSHWPKLFSLLFRLYGGRYDFFYHLEQILITIAENWHHRSPDLREQDSLV